MSKKKRGTQRKNSKNKKKSEGQTLVFEIIGLAMIGLAVIMIFEFGIAGRALTSLSMFFLGNWHGAIPLLLITQALIFMIKRKADGWKNRIISGFLFILASIVLISHVHLFKELNASQQLLTDSSLKETWKVLISNGGIAERTGALGGGMFGAFLFAMFYSLFDSAGATVAGILLLLIGLVLLTGKAFVPIIAEKFPKAVDSIKKVMAKKKSEQKLNQDKAKTERATRSRRSQATTVLAEEMAAEQIIENPVMEPEPEPTIISFTNLSEKTAKDEHAAVIIEPVGEEYIETEEEIDTYSSMDDDEENQTYILPPTSLLQATPFNDQSGERSSMHANKKILQDTLNSFGVGAIVGESYIGPSVTKYEVHPQPGVKVSRIVSLADDIALALAARDIRIEAPIPGKRAVGIEVPNQNVSAVSLREVIDARENSRPNSKLLISLGKDVTGQAILAELNKMPHVLIAGATGSGKSVCINGIIISILMRAKPHEVKLMMIDPKMVELNVYNGVPHLLAPVVTDPRKASQALKKVVSEMERRYELFSHTGTRNIEGYNEQINDWNLEHDEKHPRMPYIVVIVDELADLMMVASSDVEDSITRLAQMARAAGIHLIIATQRPSVDVITGVIKANIPSRIAFAVSSAIDSRTILDTGGADKLLGRGDMLFLPAGVSKPIRIQGAFVSDQEVEAVVDFVIEQQKAQYQEEMIPTDIEEIPAYEETDELYDDAVQLVTDLKTASVSMLQRRFRIGYSRAARIVDQMEMRGVVGPHEGSKPRQVLVEQDEVDTHM